MSTGSDLFIQKSMTPFGPSQFIILKNKVQKYSESLPNTIILSIQKVPVIRKMYLFRYLYQNSQEELVVFKADLKNKAFHFLISLLQAFCNWNVQKGLTQHLTSEIRSQLVSSFIITQAGTCARLSISGKRLTLGKLFYTTHLVTTHLAMYLNYLFISPNSSVRQVRLPTSTLQVGNLGLEICHLCKVKGLVSGEPEIPIQAHPAPKPIPASLWVTPLHGQIHRPLPLMLEPPILLL